MKYFVLLGALALLAVGPIFSYASGGNPEKGKEYFAVCQSCHGEQGSGKQEPGAPRIEG